MGRNFIWLFGENLAATSNNNSYYFWKQVVRRRDGIDKYIAVSYTHLRAHETGRNLVCRLLLEKKKKKNREKT